MARPPKLTVEYFPHQIGNGKKMFTIEERYGNDGYATWFKILEILGDTANHYLDLSDPTELMYVSSKCKIDQEKLINILNDLCQLDEIDPDLWSEKIVWNQKFVDSIQSAYAKRTVPCITKPRLIAMLYEKGKIKNIKPLKEDENPNPEAPTNNQGFDIEQALKELDIPNEMIQEWIKIRRQKRVVESQIAFDTFIEEVNQTGWTVSQVIKKCIGRSWATFEAVYIQPEIDKKTSHSNNGDKTDWNTEIEQTHGTKD